ncbi:MAG TPA: fibronectin type III domain-containing protein [Baekduia sp.]
MRTHLGLISTAVFALLVCGLVAASIATAADPPLADTGAAKDVGQTQATLAATVTPRGSATSVRFDLGTSTSYGLQSASKDVGNGTDAVSVEIPVQSLAANTTYHFRVVATSDAGTTQGSDTTFKTSAVPPAPARPGASTGSARDVSLNAATLTGAVDPNSASTSYKFEYGLTTSYGSSSATQNAGAGTRSTSVAIRIGGLTAGKRYHYRIAATNSVGTTRGSDRSFVVASTATSATLAADHNPITYGGTVKLTGKLAGSKVSGVRVRLQTTPFPFGAPFADTLNPLVSNSKGEYAFTLAPVVRTTRVLVVVDGLPPFFSTPLTIRSAARAGITAVTRRSDGRVTVRGRVVPATAKGVAALQRQSRTGTWLPLTRAHVGTDGRYAITLRPRRAAMTVRTVGLPHDGGAHASGTSRSVKIAARRR